MGFKWECSMFHPVGWVGWESAGKVNKQPNQTGVGRGWEGGGGKGWGKGKDPNLQVQGVGWGVWWQSGGWG